MTRITTTYTALFLPFIFLLTFIFDSSAQFNVNHNIHQNLDSDIVFMVYDDINSDGNEDLVYRTEDTFYWKKNLGGKGTFSLPIEIYKPSICCLRPILFDYDNDGDNDLLLFGNSSGSYHILLLENIDGLGSFSSPTFQYDEFTTFPYYEVFIKDIDKDNDLDIYLVSGAGVGWLENNEGIFSFSENHIDDASVFLDIDIADFDNDNFDDVIAIEKKVYSNPSSTEYLIVWYKNNQGTFSEKNIIYSTPQKLSQIYVEATRPDENKSIFCLTSSYLQGFINLPGGIMYLEHTDANLTFEAPVYIDNGNIYSQLQFSDLDKDGYTDILAVQDGKIYWLEQKDGSDRFANSKQITNHETATCYTVGGQLLIEDIDNDGDNDLLTNLGYDGISWLENKQEKNQISFDIGAYRLSYGGFNASVDDYDSDGDLDIMTKWVDELYLLTNQGTGTYTDQVISLSTHTLADDFNEFIDIDNDGDLDIIVYLSNDDELGYFENIDGQGNFGDEIRIPLPISDSYSKMDLRDVNGDGKVDIVGSRFIQNEIYWLGNLGQNIFDAPVLLDANGVGAWQFAIYDIDADGDLDIVSFKNEFVFWNENMDGQGTFGTREILVESSTTINGLQIGDIDNDGDSDLILTHPKTVEVFHNVNNTYIAFSETEEEQSFASYADFIMKDIDGDNDLDVFIRNMEGTWYENIDGSGTLKYQEFLRIPRILQIGNTTLTQDINNIIAVEDFDNDSDMDVLGADDFTIYDNSQAQVFFSGQHEINFEVYPDYLHAVDLDNDNDLELVTISNNIQPSHANVVCFENEEAPDTIYFNKQHNIGEGYGQHLSVDIDDDGDDDLIGINRARDSIVVHQNNGDYSFTIKSLLGKNTNNNNLNPISYFELYDINDDGHDDIIYSVLNTGLFVAENTGDYNFLNSTFLVEDYSLSDFSNVSDNFSHFTINNFDDNLIPDLSYILPTENEIILITDFNIEGSYADSIVYSTDRPDQILSDDIDNDGDIDMLTRSEFFGQIVWWENIGNHEFTKNTIINEQGIELKYFDIGDIDIDNDLDIVYCHTDSQNGNIQKISTIENINEFTQFDAPKAILDSIQNIEFVQLKDFDLDTDFDILYLARSNGASSGTRRNQIGWLENFTLDDDFKHISGICYFDENNNGVLDTAEVGLSNISIQIAANYQLTNLNGEFKSILASGDYEVSAMHPDTNWVLSSDSSQYNVLLNGVSLDDNNFGFTPIRDTSIFEVYLGSAPTRCGFTVPFWLSLNNKGTQFESRLIALEIDPLVTFDSSIPNPDSTSLDGRILFWDINHFAPGQYEIIQLFFQMPSADFIGEPIYQNIYSTSNHQDSIQTDTTFFSSVINCAYDPNDKLVEPDRYADENYTLFDEELRYTIRFQNTGTDTAFNVRINDVLDTNLEISTLRVIAASHDYNTRLYPETNSVDFMFDNILLPDSTTNEIQSHGFINFAIHSKDGLDENSIIRNEAAIFFDFNDPIITNTVQNTLVSNIPINISTTIIEPFCFGDSTGVISMNIIEEIPPYSYQWNPLVGNNATNLSNLPAGSYELTITDNLGNTLQETFELNEPNELINDIIISNETDINDDGSIEILTSGGVAPYTYSWENFPDVDNNILTDLAQGNYYVTVMDNNNCSQAESIFIDFQTSTNQIGNISFLSVSPNPTNGIIRIDLELSKLEEVQIGIFDILGSKVFRSESFKTKSYKRLHDLSHLPNGVYFIEIKVGMETLKEKITLMK